jgi:hypothetical protein
VEKVSCCWTVTKGHNSVMTRIGGGNDWLLAQIESALDAIVEIDQGPREYINDRDVTPELRAAAFDRIGRYAALIFADVPTKDGMSPTPPGSLRRTG